MINWKRTLGMDGRALGELPTVPDGLDWQGYEKAGRDFLIDPSGARCYRRDKIQYAPGAYSPCEPEGQDYLSARLHPLAGQLDGFLVAAPESVEAPGGIDTRTQLLEVQCPAQPGEPAAE